MGTIKQSVEQPSTWSEAAFAMAAEAKVLSGNNLSDW